MASVLISGASIAGPALAYWLRRQGFAVTVVERSPGLRPGGQPVDIRGVALEVVARMGLGARVEALRTRLGGANVLDRNGNEIARHTDRTLSAGRHDSGDVEIFRDDLAALLHETTKADVDYRFNDSIAAIDDGAARVTVAFERGPTRDFDLVIGADGIYSGVRRLAFGPSERFLKFLSAYVAIFSVENFLQLKNWQTAIGDLDLGRGMLVLPARDHTELRVFMMFESEPLGRDLTSAQQKALLVERFKGFGWEVPRVLGFLQEAADLYFGEVAQIRMPCWSRGRVALVGDAGYCPSPRSGQGTSLALVGAYVLAAELAQSRGDHAAAFSRYEQRMRSFVDLNQALGVRRFGERASDEELDLAKNAIALPLNGA
jgi:2-polyprenyl-6-methoxyphenol hydroxylase-like FAD-dependent oxidoreductase